MYALGMEPSRFGWRDLADCPEAVLEYYAMIGTVYAERRKVSDGR